MQNGIKAELKTVKQRTAQNSRSKCEMRDDVFALLIGVRLGRKNSIAPQLTENCRKFVLIVLFNVAPKSNSTC